jgi:hypothetical protein
MSKTKFGHQLFVWSFNNSVAVDPDLVGAETLRRIGIRKNHFGSDMNLEYDYSDKLITLTISNNKMLNLKI